MECSLFSPVKTLPWYLWPVWPLIFWRIQRLQAWFRREAPPGAQMLWGIAGWGEVVVLALSDDFTGPRRAPLPGGQSHRPPCAPRWMAKMFTDVMCRWSG